MTRSREGRTTDVGSPIRTLANSPRWLAGILAVSAACIGCRRSVPPPTGAIAARSDASHPAPSAAPALPPAETDLLHAVPTTVTVSSRVSNATDRADDLVDGNLETAWNSRTGDLRGAWIDVQLPAGVTVSAIKITAGFTRVGARGDLFTMNQRVRRVRVSRDGVALGEFDLDPARRDLQTLAVTGPGGTYRIELTDFVPGTQAGWREACVSELQIWGRPGPGVASARVIPSVAVAPGPGDRAAQSAAPNVTAIAADASTASMTSASTAVVAASVQRNPDGAPPIGEIFVRGDEVAVVWDGSAGVMFRRFDHTGRPLGGPEFTGIAGSDYTPAHRGDASRTRSVSQLFAWRDGALWGLDVAIDNSSGQEGGGNDPDEHATATRAADGTWTEGETFEIGPIWNFAFRAEPTAFAIYSHARGPDATLEDVARVRAANSDTERMLPSDGIHGVDALLPPLGIASDAILIGPTHSEPGPIELGLDGWVRGSIAAVTPMSCVACARAWACFVPSGPAREVRRAIAFYPRPGSTLTASSPVPAEWTARLLPYDGNRVLVLDGWPNGRGRASLMLLDVSAHRSPPLDLGEGLAVTAAAVTGGVLVLRARGRAAVTLELLRLDLASITGTERL